MLFDALHHIFETIARLSLALAGSPLQAQPGVGQDTPVESRASDIRLVRRGNMAGADHTGAGTEDNPEIVDSRREGSLDSLAPADMARHSRADWAVARWERTAEDSLARWTDIAAR